MKKNYLFTLLLTFCFGAFSYGQTTIKFQDFEGGSDDWSFTESPATYNVSSDVWANVTTVGGTVTAPQNGANFWGMRDLENSNGGSASDHTLTFDSVDVTGKTGVEISFYYISDGFDTSDYLKVEIFHDGVSQGVVDLDKNTDAWTKYSKSVPDAVNSVKVTIIAKQNGGSDYAGVDNFKVQEGVAATCGFSYGTATATCETFTGGVDTSDTYSVSIPYSGGVSGLSVSSSSGTVGGDDPATTPSGTITITGVVEGTNITVTVSDGSICNEKLDVNSPTNCVVPKTFPIHEPFNQTVGTDLIADPYWINASTSTDEIKLASATIGNPFSSTQFPDPTGNMVTFDGSGSDTYSVFPVTNSGMVYVSFIFTASDISGLTNTNGGYFAVLAESMGSYRGRLWLRQDTTDNTKYNVGVTTGSSGATYHTFMHTPGEEIFVVIGYDFSTNDLKIWIDPDPANFEAGSAPTETLKVTASGSDIPADLGRFLLRQDSSSETPTINFDELRISTSWADVTPKGSTASIGENTIDGFAAYPNPVTGGVLTIKTANATAKTVNLYNVLGRQILSQKFNSNTMNINTSGVTPGIYILKVVEGANVATQKILIR